MLKPGVKTSEFIGALLYVLGTLIASLTDKLDPKWAAIRSEERRVGKECRSRWSPYH